MKNFDLSSLRNAFCFTLTACVLGMSVSEAAAFEKKGGYGFVRGGFNYVNDQDIEVGVNTVESKLDPGFVALGGFGYDFGSFRAEGEISYRHNEIDIHTSSFPTPGSRGENRSIAFMANGYYDYSNPTDFTPYVGGGLGIASVAYDDYGITGATVLSDDDWVLAYQLMAGLDYDLTDQFTLGAEYRYFATQDADIRTAAGNNDIDVEYQNHSVSLGLKYRFSPTNRVYARKRY